VRHQYMRYTFFEITNFKGIRQARLDLASTGAGARIITLVGLNESGKTTVLEAIDYFQATRDDEIGPNQLAGWVRSDPGDLIPVAERTNFTGEITIRCGLKLTDDDFVAVRDYLENQDGYELLSINRSVAVEEHYEYRDSHYTGRRATWSDVTGEGRAKGSRRTRQLRGDEQHLQSAVRFIRARFPGIWFFPNFLFDFPDRIYIEASQDERPANRFYRLLIQDILDSLPRHLDLDTHVIQRFRSANPADQQNLQQVLLAAGRHITDTVVTAWNSMFTNRPLSSKRVVLMIGEDELGSGTATPGKLWVRFLLDDADGLFSVRERSLGFRWFFVYLLITTYRARRKQASQDMLFLFDEPASNLHPSAQAALLSSLELLSQEAVIVYTTHSHHLINPAWLGATYVVANQGLSTDAISVDFTAKRTDIRITPYRRFAAENPEQSHFFQPILDVLDYAPSGLELVPNVVMVEGKSDFYLLSYYQSVIRAKSRQDSVALLPGGGAGSLDRPIQLYVAWSRPFIVMLDSDEEGRTQSNRYIDRFGAILQPHLTNLSEATGDPKVKAIETLLDPEDRLEFQRVIDPGATRFQKKTFALGVQEALVTRKAVNISATARARFDSLFPFLERRLAEVAGRML
jgi:predicted ATPase